MKDQNNLFLEGNGMPNFEPEDPLLLKKQPGYAVSSIESRIENNRSFYGSFFLGPFLPGQSLTIANAIRRTLLSDLKGIAIVSVQIQGVLHEYSSIPGVRDSVLDILLNMKEIVLKNKYSNNSRYSVFPQIGYLHVQGPGVVRAADLKLPPFIQIVDPNQYIATLAHDGSINMKFLISEGKSFIGKDLPVDFKQGMGSDRLKNSITVPYITNHYNHLKKRNLLLKKIKNAIKTASKEPKGAQLRSKDASQKPLNPSGFANKNSAVSGTVGQKTFSNLLKNSKPLHIDAVFSPITKVNYIIEFSEHKTIDNSFSKSQQIKDFLNLVKPLKQLSPGEHLRPSKQNQKSKNNTNTFSSEELLNLLADTSMSSLNQLNNLEAKTFHNIVLEIWTNGSLHPKEALSLGLKELNTIISEIAGLQEIWRNTQNFDLQQFKYERNYQKLDLLLNTYTSYNFIPLNNSYYSSNYSFKYNKNFNSANSANQKNQLRVTDPYKISSAKIKGSPESLTQDSEGININKKFSLSLNPTNTNYSKSTQLVGKFQTENRNEKSLNELDISNLNLSLGTYTILKRANINTLGDIVTKSKKDLLLSTKLSLKTLGDIEKSLLNFGLNFSF